MQLDLGAMNAEGLDRLVDHDLVAVDCEAAGGDDFRDVAGRNGAVELSRVTGGANGDEGLAFELGGDGFGFLLEFEIVGFQL